MNKTFFEKCFYIVSLLAGKSSIPDTETKMTAKIAPQTIVDSPTPTRVEEETEKEMDDANKVEELMGAK